MKIWKSKIEKLVKNQRKAQTLIEYVVILTIVTTALYAMTPMIKRGMQSMIKVTADQIGDQPASEQSRSEASDGYMLSAESTMDANIIKTRTEGGGSITYGYNDTITTSSNSATDLGTIEQ